MHTLVPALGLRTTPASVLSMERPLLTLLLAL